MLVVFSRPILKNCLAQRRHVALQWTTTQFLSNVQQEVVRAQLLQPYITNRRVIDLIELVGIQYVIAKLVILVTLFAPNIEIQLGREIR